LDHALAVRRAGLTGVAFGLVGLLAPRPAVASAPPAPELDIELETEPEASAEPPALAAIPVRPPRISGTYLGMSIWPGMSWAYSPNLAIDQSRVIPGGGGALHLGQAVFPWMTLGIDASGGFYFTRDTLFMEGGLLVELGFYPVPRYPFSLRGGFGFGAGLILDDRVDNRGGVGGARFMGALRYEFFPKAERKRPDKAGGWTVGPELAWRGFPPAGKDRPMSHTILLGLYFGFYWGE
jgi:hypothetical protein